MLFINARFLIVRFSVACNIIFSCLYKKTDYSKGEVDKTPVVGLLERGGKIKTFVVPNTKAEILQPIMQEHVEKSATDITDSYTSYIGLESDFKHVRVKGNSAAGDYRTAIFIRIILKIFGAP